MKKILSILFLILIALSFFVWQKFCKGNISVNELSNKLPVTSETPFTQKERKILFVPYWTVNKNERIDGYDSLVYFGITADTKGINKEEDGFKGMTSFIKNSDAKEKLLTLRMLNTQENLAILKDEELQKRIATESLEIANNNSFNGVVLDFEVSAMPFQSLIDKINNFYKIFYSKSKEKNMKFALTIYGDSYYRVRPYDVKEISKNSDEIMIMAYDFYKPRGDSGPNFPLTGKERFGYDLKTMLDEFLKDAQKDKIEIIFGMYGYDWKIDENKKTMEQAQALTLNEITKNYIEKCNFQNCVAKRDSDSSEMEINYLDKEQKNHVIWFEDQKSLKNKMDYLKSKGINKVGFWAYSYF